MSVPLLGYGSGGCGCCSTCVRSWRIMFSSSVDEVAGTGQQVGKNATVLEMRVARVAGM